MKARIHNFVVKSPIGNSIIGFLIIASVVTFSLETEYDNNALLRRLTLLIASLFLIEYVIRVWTADLGRWDGKKGRLTYIFSFYGIVDLLAFLPALLFPNLGGSVILRLLRMLRLVQILKIKALSNGLNRISKAMYETRTELLVSLSASILLIFIGAALMYLVEGDVQPEAFGSIPRALWWSMATLTTVGYGDVFPITAFGRVLASMMALVGIGAVALPAGILAAAFTKKTDVEPKS